MISKYAEWVDVWQELVKYGWSCQTGDSLANYIFYSKKCQDKTPKEVRKDFIENQDYFTSEDSVKQFIRDHYGWKGPEAKKNSSSTSSSGGRQKRKRRRKTLEGSTASSPLRKKETGGNAPIQPDQCQSYDGPREPMEQPNHRSDVPFQEEPNRYYPHYGDHSATSTASVHTPEIKEQSEEDYSFALEANKKCRKGTSMKDRLDVVTSCLGVAFDGHESMFQQLEILENRLYGPNVPRQGRFVDRIEELEGEMGF